LIFIDNKKVFVSVRREEIWKCLEKLGISTDLLRKVKNTCEKTTNCVETNKRQSSWFKMRLVVRQGSVL
jgi:hypothetical protein